MNQYEQIQVYFMDEWVNTVHKTRADILEEAKIFGDGKLRKMKIGSSWFDWDTFYYLDSVGCFVIFRGVSSFHKELFSKKLRRMSGNKNINGESIVKTKKEITTDNILKTKIKTKSVTN